MMELDHDFSLTWNPKSESLSENNYTADDYYDCQYEDYSGLKKIMNIVSITVYSIAFVFGVLGNGLVIWVTGFRMKKTVNTVWFLNLAVADFFFTIFLPFTIIYAAFDFHWPFGNILCKIISTVLFLNMFASIFLLTVISFDRCLTVIHPVWSQNHRTVQLASVVAIFAWTVSIILSAPYFAFRDTGSIGDNTTVCYNNFALSDNFDNEEIMQLHQSRHQAIIITRFLCGFLIPFTIIITCYTIIASKLRKNQLTMSSKPFKVIIAVIVTFFICWLPYHVISFLELVSTNSSECNEELERAAIILVPLITSLPFLNSCMNPILYVFMGRDFRQSFRKSILFVFESAFSEDSAMSTINSKHKSKSTSTVY
ncbi:chemokine-like receptor 1 [Protopterus annectens]|uniref:chemokine-like receptor 1 n=1 Tax=Protopterus annectens TaxID=7888 RepID=UPI001CFB01B4|nr:chemokine-like receptor 1 [Protopterus annectens]